MTEPAAPRALLSSGFAIGDRVTIDGEKDLTVTVISLQFTMRSYIVEVSWVHNGAIASAWLSPWRLTLAND